MRRLTPVVMRYVVWGGGRPAQGAGPAPPGQAVKHPGGKTAKMMRARRDGRRRQLVTLRVPPILLILVCLSWSTVRAEDYKYPYRDPYVATTTAAILNSDDLTPKLKRQVVHVPGLAGRDQLPALEGRGELKVTLYRQNRPAPLLFILSGTGTNPYFGLATYFAGLFHAEGSHIVILPSPMTWNFALAASRSGAPGYVPDDARDLYEAMQKTLEILKVRHDVKITRINFLGASLGALEGAHLSVIDAEERKILLPELVYVTQVIHDQGVLKAPKEQVRKRLEEAKGFTFKDYSEKIGVPLWRVQTAAPDADLDSFTTRGSLASILDQIRGNDKVHIMHNADDFLADRKSVEELKGALGDQVKLYPYGGHLGNLWYPENREYLLGKFRTPP